jgi:RAD51-like protein 2
MSTSRLLQRRHADNIDLQAKVSAGCSANKLLERIHVYRCTDLAEQTAALMGLAPFLDAHPRVKIVVIDSLAFHYRYMDTDMPARSRHLQQMAQQMHRLASCYNVAVLVVNQMTTKVDGSAGSGASLEGALSDGTLVASLAPEARNAQVAAVRLFPALGEVWAHACTNRLLLGWAPSSPAFGGSEAFVRAAQLVKSPSRAPGFAHFCVTSEGIRGLRKIPAATPSASLESGMPASPWVSGTKRSAAEAELLSAMERHEG